MPDTYPKGGHVKRGKATETYRGKILPYQDQQIKGETEGEKKKCNVVVSVEWGKESARMKKNLFRGGGIDT